MSMTHLSRLLAVLLMSLPTVANAQTNLSDAEKAMTTFVDGRYEDAIAYLERVVNINSGSMNFDGVKAVGAVFDETFKEMGFRTWWVDGSDFERAGHLFAQRGTRGPHVLMIGHLDTVFEDDSEFQTFSRLDEHTAMGPGVIDMKGGDVVIVEVLRALEHMGVLDDLTITVALIGDEESSGDPLEVGRASLVEAAKNADIALAFEPGDGRPETAVVARRGFTGWELRTTGTRAHSSTVFTPKSGYGAIYEASRILVGFYETMVGEEHLTFNPGAILGGTTLSWDDENEEGEAFGKSNVIAGQALVSGDLRTLSLEQRARAKERMLAVVEEHLPGTDATLTFRDSYPPMGPTDGNHRLLEQLSAVSQDLGLGPVGPVDPGEAGAADISFAAGHVDMALDGLGILGEGTHTTHETADLRTLPMQVKRVALLLYRMSR
jgi:glutamate carboxypeptidase